MNEKHFECTICLAVCRQCINCIQCHAILCREHVNDIRDDRCPTCRSAPFQYQKNIALQRIIDQIQQQNDSAVRPISTAVAKRTETETSNPSVTSTIPVPDGYANPIGDRGVKIPRESPNQDQFKKIPNDSHKTIMVGHVFRCEHEGCRSVWKGRWGQFIGGRKGSTHFDLTRCPVGKELNEMIGWNYDDPRH